MREVVKPIMKNARVKFCTVPWAHFDTLKMLSVLPNVRRISFAKAIGSVELFTTARRSTKFILELGSSRNWMMLYFQVIVTGAIIRFTYQLQMLQRPKFEFREGKEIKASEEEGGRWFAALACTTNFIIRDTADFYTVKCNAVGEHDISVFSGCELCDSQIVPIGLSYWIMNFCAETSAPFSNRPCRRCICAAHFQLGLKLNRAKKNLNYQIFLLHKNKQKSKS